MKDKILDCITFFDNNFMFDLRYNILKVSPSFSSIDGKCRGKKNKLSKK